jgi:hypothetical protein
MRKPDRWAALLEQRSQSVLTLMIMALVILLIQLWLLTISLEDFMAARSTLAIPTFAASAFCLLINLWLLHYLNRLDKKENGR